MTTVYSQLPTSPLVVPYRLPTHTHADPKQLSTRSPPQNRSPTQHLPLHPKIYMYPSISYCLLYHVPVLDHSTTTEYLPIITNNHHQSYFNPKQSNPFIGKNGHTVKACLLIKLVNPPFLYRRVKWCWAAWAELPGLILYWCLLNLELLGRC